MITIDIHRIVQQLDISGDGWQNRMCTATLGEEEGIEERIAHMKDAKDIADRTHVFQDMKYIFL